MLLPIDTKIAWSSRRLAKIFCVVIVFISLAVLVGWVTNNDILIRINPKWPAMKPATALILILSALALQMLAPSSKPGAKIKLAKVGYVLAWIILIIALSELIQYFLHSGSSFEDFLSEKIFKGTTPENLRMTFFADICFTLIGFVFIGKKHRVKDNVLQFTSLAVAILSFMGVLNYMFWAKNTADIFGEKIGFHTSVCLSMLSLAILFSEPDCGLMTVVSSRTVGGKLIRNLLPKIILLLLILMELRYTAQQLNLIDQNFGTVLSSTIAIALISFVLYRASRSLGFEDLKRQQAEEKTALANKSLIEQTRELEQLIYVTSHDLAEPVKTISNYSALLLEKYDTHFDNQASKYFAFLKQSTTTMKEVIRDVLIYTTVGKSKVIELIDCNKLLKETLDQLGEKIAQNQATIHINPLPTIRCYKELKLVFFHLICNAIKFRKPNVPPDIYINCISKDDHWQFMFKDNGIGINMEYSEKIFQMFQKLHSKYTYEGVGIGLALSKKIILLHRGELWVKSEPGHGSTFYFTIPKLLTDETEIGTNNAD